MRTRNVIGLLGLLVVSIVVAVVAPAGTGPESVRAAGVCTWQGDVSRDWFDAANWTTCVDEHGTAKAPGNLDVVVVGGGGTYNPQFIEPYDYQVNFSSLTIESDGVLNVNTGVEFVGAQFDNDGTISVGNENYWGAKFEVETFNNDGTVDAGAGYASMKGSGSHNGDFLGNYVNFGIHAPSPITNTFQTSSSIDVDTIYFAGDGSHYDINGSFDCDGFLYVRDTGTKVMIEADGLVGLGTPVVDSDAELIVAMGGTVTGSLDVTAGAVMTGTGTIDGDLLNAGTVAPGASPGTIGVTGVYTQEETGVLAIELGGTAAGTGYDQVVVTGTATLSGTLEVALIDGFLPSLGDTFEIVRYGSREGEFDEVNLPQLDPGYILSLTYETDTLLLTVTETFSIGGTVTYDGTDPAATEIEVNLFTSPNQGPIESITIAAPSSPYTFTNVPEGVYYLSASIDLNGSGGPPDSDEPAAWYDTDGDGAPDAITVGSASVAGIDLMLHDTTATEKGAVAGTVTYDGTDGNATEIEVNLFLSYPTVGGPVASIAIPVPGGVYTFTNLDDGDVYISAMIELDGISGPPSPTEPSAWYDADQDGTPDAITVSDGATVTDIDLTLHDKFLVFLPLVVRGTP